MFLYISLIHSYKFVALPALVYYVFYAFCKDIITLKLYRRSFIVFLRVLLIYSYKFVALPALVYCVFTRFVNIQLQICSFTGARLLRFCAFCVYIYI